MSDPFPYINRELSWLEFNQRVLNEAWNDAIPVLERLRFLAITASNLDEFFMVRVGSLQTLVDSGNERPDPAGLTPSEQLHAVSARTHVMQLEQYRCLNEKLEPLLREAGLKRLTVGELNERQTKSLEASFEAEIFSVLTPIAVTARGTLPLVANHTLNLCVKLKPAADAPETPRFAVIPFGRTLTRFYALGSERGYSFIPLEDIVTRFIDRFFPGEEVLECAAFRITRNADLSLREDQAEDLIAGVSAILNQRKRSDCVRLETVHPISRETHDFLQKTFELEAGDVFEAPGPVDLSAFMQLADWPGFDANRYEPWPPQRAPEIEAGASMFETIARRDLLLYHPYQSFEPVVRFVEEAANDPDVLAIKQILYRTSRKSPIVAALAKAAQRGKHVTVIVELRARFDEARNIEWARDLEQAGVHVLYGVKGYKTHAKMCVVIRREPQGIQRYVHFGTGNYNEATSRIYSDVSLFTAHEEFGADAVSFFNAITGYSQPLRYRKIEAAPTGLREKILEMIDNETQRKETFLTMTENDGLRKQEVLDMIEKETKRKRQDEKAEITAKLNSLVDPEIIQALYRASVAGVKIRLNVRGICCLRPGVPGVSEHIEVVSIIDRFLEHARIIHFRHGGDDRVFISSADWMPRNLDGRIELLVPVEDPDYRRRLIDLLNAYFTDNVKARKLQSDGSYKAVEPADPAKAYRCQQIIFEEACRLAEQTDRVRSTMFEPHRAPGKSETDL